MLRPSGEQWMQCTRAPRRSKSSGARTEAEPFAQSATIVNPSKTSGQRCGQVIHVGAVQARVYRERRGRRVSSLGEKRKDLFLEQLFLFVRQLIARMTDQLDAVVLIRIVRRRNHHSRRERPVLGEISDSRRGGDAGEIDRYSMPCQSGCHFRSQPRPRFAGVHSDYHLFKTGSVWIRSPSGRAPLPPPARSSRSSGGCPATPRIPSVPNRARATNGHPRSRSFRASPALLYRSGRRGALPADRRRSSACERSSPQPRRSSPWDPF